MKNGLFAPGLIHTYLTENFQTFLPEDSPRSLLWNEIWKPYLLQEVTKWETKMVRHVFEAGRRNSTRLKWKHALLEPLWLSLGCFSELGRLTYLIWKRNWEVPADMKIRTVIQLIGILWSYFGTLRGLPTVSYILVCHSATPWSRSDYHTSD